ncbi:MAG: DNA-3-methyladenine glycosylase I [Chloroflexota bacterium]
MSGSTTDRDADVVPRTRRCAWAGTDPRMVAYHDAEWGQPLHDERALFELLCLEGAQAGLSWTTILNRRDGYRAAYEGFDAARIAAYDDARQAELLLDTRIIRNRAKVHAFRENARAVLALRTDAGGLEPWLWAFVDGRPIVNHWRGLGDIPASTPLSVAVSKAFGKRGFRFVGPTIVYAYLQSAGLVNDHTVDCFRHPDNAGMPPPD